MRIYIGIVVFVCCFVMVVPAYSFDPVDRRKDQYGKDFGYYVYPIVGNLPGLGTAKGLGGTVLNLGGTDADITGYFIRGDFSASGLAFIDLQLIPKRLVLDFAYNDYLVAPIQFNRGLDSDENEFIQPKAEGQYVIGQLTLSFSDRRYEAFLRPFNGKERLLEVLDKEGNSYQGISQAWHYSTNFSVGGSIDFTDDRLDPRTGNRLELNIHLPRDAPASNTEYLVTDLNLTHYFPLRRWDTLVFNVFGSHAFVTRKGITDYATVKAYEGLDCEAQIPAGPERDACLRTEATSLNQIIAHRTYGTASSLGGTQRLRSFSNYRYYASKVFFYGLEYRWNLTDEHTPFNIYVARGIRTGIQLAAFVERGSVSDGYRQLYEDGRNSYGLGFRLVLSGVVIRLDAATGDEGFQTQLFITYPWSMFSVDSPG